MTADEFNRHCRELCALYSCSETSGIRTEERNAAVGGAAGSRHKLRYGGLARDLVPDDNTAEVRALLAGAAMLRGLTALDEGDHVHVHADPD